MVQSNKTIKSIYAIIGMGAVTALLIAGSEHVAIPFSFTHFGNLHQPDGITLLNQQAANICASNVVDKGKIKIEAKDGALVKITCVIRQSQTIGPIDPVLSQVGINNCVSNVTDNDLIKVNKNKIEIKAKDGSAIFITCTINQRQSAGAIDPLMSQNAINICGSNIGSKNKIEIKAKDGSAVLISCIITQTQRQIQTPQPSPPVDPIQDATNICGSNIGSKNKLKIDVKDGSKVAITCENTQTQTMAVDPLLVQDAVNICGSNIGDKNKIEIKAKDGSSVLIACSNTQTQTQMPPFIDP